MRNRTPHAPYDPGVATRTTAPRGTNARVLSLRVAGERIDVAVPDGMPTARFRARLVRWLKGRDDDFGDVALPRGTEFQRACWQACRTIPRGEVRTYGWVAREAGRPGAARAVGQAMRRNPMPIAVPCHRVVGAGTRLGGYAGAEDGASERVKRTLQATERRAPRLRYPVPQERNAR